MKKAISVLLTIVMLLGIIGIGALAVSEDNPTIGYCGENVTWRYNTDTQCLTISGTGEMFNYTTGEYYIEHDWRLVTTAPWGQYGYSIKTVIINDGVTSIGDFAFYCKGLTSITLPDSITTIGLYAFYNCSSLTNITIPSNVKSIGDSTFYGCSGLTSITIPDFVTTIDKYAFCCCFGLTFINIPDSVTTIGRYAFSLCYSAISVSVPDNVKSIGENAFNSVNNIVYSGTSPGNPWGAKCVNGYTEGYLVYNDSSKIELKGCSASAKGKISIPDTVKGIASNAFIGCNDITEVYIPGSLKVIPDNAFKNCKGLKTFSLGAGITRIGSNAFENCINLENLTIGDDIEDIGANAFKGCFGLKNLSIGASVKRIGDNAFKDCKNLENLIFSNGVEYICRYAFYGCKGLKSVTIPGSVAYCYEYSFGDCDSLETVIIIRGALISRGAFDGCDNLENIYIPKSAVGSNICSNCNRLRDVFFEGSYEERPSLDSNDRLLAANWHYNSTIDNMTSNGVHILTFEDNQGYGAPVIQAGNGYIFISPFSPERSGYTFLGWATSKSATSAQYNAGSLINLDKDITLYAVWQKNETPENPDNPTNPTTPTEPTPTEPTPTEPETPTEDDELIKAKSAAKAEIDKAVPAGASDAVKKIASDAKAKIDKVSTVDEIEADKDTAINEIGKLYAKQKKEAEEKEKAEAEKKITVNSASGTITNVKYNQPAKIIASSTGLPKGYKLAIYEGGSPKSVVTANDKGEAAVELETEALTSDRTFTVKVLDASGKEIDGKSKTFTIDVNDGFFQKIISFFLKLFGALKLVEIKP